VFLLGVWKTDEHTCGRVDDQSRKQILICEWYGKIDQLYDDKQPRAK
jgi:hypothetical protein